MPPYEVDSSPMGNPGSATALTTLFWTLRMGFKAREGCLIYTLTCLRTVNLRVTFGATPAFTTNGGVHCISVCTADWPSRHPSCKQRRAGNCFKL